MSKQQLLLPRCVCESLACPEAEVWDLLALPPCKPKGCELTQLSWNLSRSNQDCWQAGTESWQHNKGTLVSLKFLGSFGQGAGMWSHGRVGVASLRQRRAVGPGDRTVGLGACWCQLRVSLMSLLAGSSLDLFFFSSLIWVHQVMGQPCPSFLLSDWAEAVRCSTRTVSHWARRLRALLCTGFGTTGSPSCDRAMHGVPL